MGCGEPSCPHAVGLSGLRESAPDGRVETAAAWRRARRAARGGADALWGTFAAIPHVSWDPLVVCILPNDYLYYDKNIFLIIIK